MLLNYVSSVECFWGLFLSSVLACPKQPYAKANLDPQLRWHPLWVFWSTPLALLWVRAQAIHPCVSTGNCSACYFLVLGSFFSRVSRSMLSQSLKGAPLQISRAFFLCRAPFPLLLCATHASCFASPNCDHDLLNRLYLHSTFLSCRLETVCRP